MEIFGKRLKELRNEKGLSTMALGKIIGTSDASISRWENNIVDATGEHIAKLAKYFGVSADYLLGLSDY